MCDKMAVLQVFGCILKKPEILIDEKYNLAVNDFPEKFHQIVFSAINNLIANGVNIVNLFEIDNYLSKYEKQYKIFTDNNGMEYLQECINLSETENFDYNYSRVRKFSLLNDFRQKGFDITGIYNENVIDIKQQEKMQMAFDSMSSDDIINYFDKKITDIKSTYCDSQNQHGQLAGKGMMELKEELKQVPDMGAPLQSKMLNTIVRGARLKKLYMRSLPSGVGKTRIAAGDICGIAVPYLYNLKTKQWDYTGFSEPCLFITTELEIAEIQTLMMAFLSGVDESHIIDGKYEEDEEERVNQAIEYYEQSPLWIEEVPNFNIDDIERVVKKYKINHNIGYVFFDYIFMSTKMLIEIATKTKGISLREDNVLYIFVDRMKSLCNTLNIHFDTSSQLNGDWKNVKDGDQNLLRGAKSMSDKLDFGAIGLPVTKKDLDALQPILSKGFYPEPNLCLHIYKVRRGRFNKVKLWMHVDLGTCRTEDLFLTNNDYELIPIESTTIEKILEQTEDKDDELLENNSKEENKKKEFRY